MTTNGPRVTAEEFLQFNEQLLGLVRTNMPLDQGLREMGAEIGRGRLKNFVTSVAEDLQRGQQLSEALERFRPQISEYYLALVRAGEKGNSLAEILHHVVTETRRQIDHRRALLTSMAYPVTVLVIALAIFTFVCLALIPQFVGLYRELGADLPKLTQTIVDAHAWIVRNIVGVAIVAAAVVSLLAAFAKGYVGRPFRDALLFWIPVVRHMVLNDVIITFARSVGFLLQRGVPVVDALTLTQSVMSNVIAQEFVGRVRAGVEQGKSLSEMLDRYPYFPLSTRWMIRLSEERGDLGDTLTDLADFYQTKQQHLREAFRGLVEPLLIVMVGILVGTLVIALYLPLFTIPKVLR